VRTIAPLGYSTRRTGAVGELIARTAISHYRPAHIHFLLNVPGYEPLITHLFEKGAQYLDSDVVFGTKAELVVQFERREPGPTPDGGTSEVSWLLAGYDFVLQPRPERPASRPDRVRSGAIATGACRTRAGTRGPHRARPDGRNRTHTPGIRTER
jgi:protocatechuate 3,4-dioxygenase beta subunit